VLFDGKRASSYVTFMGHNGHVTGLTFTPDGRRLVTAGIDRTVRFWDVETGRSVLVLHGSRFPFQAVQCGRDGRFLIALNRGRIQVFPAQGGPPRGQQAPYRWVRWHRERLLQVWDSQWSAVAPHCARLLEADPANEAIYRTHRAFAASKLDDWRQVEADLTRVLELTKPTAILLNLRGQAYFALRQYAQAEEDRTKALDLDPEYRLAWAQRGEARARLGRWKVAIEDYTQAIKLDKKPAETWHLRGTAWAELGEWEKAISDFRQAIERAPSERRYLRDLAVAHLGAAEFAAYRRACVSLYERLSHTDQVANWNTIAWVCCLASNAIDPDHLVRLMDKALAAIPKNYTLLNTKGAALYRAGRFEDAIRQLNEAITAHGKGGSFEDLVFLAMTQSRLKQADKASETLKKAIALYERGFKPAKSGPPPLDWSTRVEWRQLRKEAESLIQNDKR
jgi:tetratricopeptide (TPR) repeat protein